MSELAPRPSLQDRPNHGLVSLWDMFELQAREFVQALRDLQFIEDIVAQNHDGVSDPIDIKQLPSLSKRLNDLMEACCDLGATITADFVGDTQQKLSGGNLNWGDLAKDARLIYAVLLKEMAHAKLFAIPQEKISYFDDAFGKFDVDVIASYFSANDDIDEAGKCFAFGRYTACVFHLMRVLERPIHGLAKVLLPDNQTPNWGTVLTKIDSELAKKPADRSFKGDVQFFSEVAAEMRAVQHAWRNRVMHIDNLVTEERAKAIFDATVSLMNVVAKRIDENGQIDPNLELGLETPPQS